ncbi:MAG: acyltransferase domain-containing protein, partial [Gammaproteobacteria bacterium]|nr:acyltransferase domain-containing protein [Gammaproteobacteria bacterium]
LYNNKAAHAESFKDTLLTHPAIFMLEHALLQVLYEKKIQPDMVLGSSLGEFAAAVAANILSFEEAMSIVTRQAQLLDKNCQEAGMLAILHDPIIYQQQDNIKKYSEIAAINFSSHFVVSGKNQDLNNIVDQLKNQHIASHRLPVSHGFHSTYIDNAEQSFKFYAAEIIFHEPTLPFISCVNADKLGHIKSDHLWDIIRRPIQFEKVIQLIEIQGNVCYVDLGPSGTLSTFVKYNLSSDSQSRYFHILTPYHQDFQSIEGIFNTLQSIAFSSEKRGH